MCLSYISLLYYIYKTTIFHVFIWNNLCIIGRRSEKVTNLIMKAPALVTFFRIEKFVEEMPNLFSNLIMTNLIHYCWVKLSIDCRLHAKHIYAIYSNRFCNRLIYRTVCKNKTNKILIRFWILYLWLLSH